jgi:hypothetical protein
MIRGVTIPLSQDTTKVMILYIHCITILKTNENSLLNNEEVYAVVH